MADRVGTAASSTVGLVLEGGRSNRMGSDKSQTELDCAPLVERMVRRLAPQVEACAVGASGDPSRYDWLKLPILADPLPDEGPLGGLLAGLRWAADVGAAHVLTVACDTPFFPLDLAEKLSPSIDRDGSVIAVAQPDGRAHHIFAVYPVNMADTLHAWPERSESRAVRRWVESQLCWRVEFDGHPDPFFNLNDPDESSHRSRAVRHRSIGGAAFPPTIVRACLDRTRVQW